MHNVKALIGNKGARFKNSFVNYSLCCPSRATFLTGQYAHNHGVLDNTPPDGGFPRFESLHGDNNLAVWLQDSGYYTALIGKYLNGYDEQPACAAGLVGVVRISEPGRLQLQAERERHPGPLRAPARRLQAGRADQKGGRTSSTAGRRSRSRSSSGSPTRRRTGAVFRTRTRRRTVAAPRRRRRATPMPSTPSRCRSPRTSTSADVSDKPAAIRSHPLLNASQIADIQRRYRCQLESLLSVDEGVKKVVQALVAKRELANTLLDLHVGQWLLQRGAPDPPREGADLRGVDPGAAPDARPGHPAGARRSATWRSTPTWPRRSSTSRTRTPAWSWTGAR